MHRVLAVLSLALGLAQAQASCPEPCAQLGAFAVGVQRISLADKDTSMNSANRSVRMQLRLHNTGSEPLLFAFKKSSLQVSDEQGLDYAVRNDAVQGMGLIGAGGVDTQFEVAPGASRDFQLQVHKGYATRPQRLAPQGRRFTLNFVIAELQPQSTDRVRVRREHAVTLADAPASALSQAGQGAQGLQELRQIVKALGR